MKQIKPTKIIQSPLFSIEQIRAMEKKLFEKEESFSVMQRAAQVAVSVILDDQPPPNQVLHVLLGRGNNAGDGLLVGAMLKERGFDVSVYCLLGEDFQGDASKAYQFARSQGVVMKAVSFFEVQQHDIVVDAIFGIGLDRNLEAEIADVIRYVNAKKLQYPSLKVYALDLPTGIFADTGAEGNVALLADKTITFIGDKVGLHTASGKGYAGEIIVDNLGSEQVASQHKVFRYHCQSQSISSYTNNHKGDYGHVLVVGGGEGMFGAAAMAAVSALKVGVGKSSLYCHPDYQTQFHLQGTPLYEVMRQTVLDDVACYSAIILGVGLGREQWGEKTFEILLSNRSSGMPTLIDADGLWHLADKLSLLKTSGGVDIITPHEAEASRLLDCSIEAICRNKLEAVLELAKKYQCIAVLKGAGTLISDGSSVWINENGNLCLATAGTGDVLAGIIGGYLAQGFDPLHAALYGVFKHGAAADEYLNKTEKSMRATDLWRFL